MLPMKLAILVGGMLLIVGTAVSSGTDQRYLNRKGVTSFEWIVYEEIVQQNCVQCHSTKDIPFLKPRRYTKYLRKVSDLDEVFEQRRHRLDDNLKNVLLSVSQKLKARKKPRQ